MNMEALGTVVLLLLIGFGAGYALASVLERSPTPERPAATGIYGTVHMPEGDFATGPPTRVVIDGAMTTYHLPIYDIPFSGEISRVGLHINGLTTEVRVVPPVTVTRGERVTIVQPVEMVKLTARHPPEGLP